MAPYVYQIVLIFLLICGSAFFSGAETTYSNITRRQIKQLKESKSKLSKLASSLLNHPRQLLNCFLFGNMTVNVLYYAASSILIIKVNKENPLAGGIIAFSSFVIILLFGEILPKSLAYANSRSLSVIFALPTYFFLKIYTPLEVIFKYIILEPFLRLLLGPKINPRAITTSEFISLIESTKKKGLISEDENRLLTEVIELGNLKVRHVMKPRVDMITCAVTDSNLDVREKMHNHHLTKLPVYTGSIDNIAGVIHFRELLLNENVPLSKIIRNVNYVPEQKTIESMLEFFLKTKTDIAIVVDEYGGIAGSVVLEDIAEELFGQIEHSSQSEPIEQTGPFMYRLRGNLAVHDWIEMFGIDLDETQQATIGGLVTALLGKIPKKGDIVHIRNLKFTVEKIHRNRIESIILSFEPFRSEDS
ncbi:MAG: HlyC/CorC family transporter [Sedimentisphaerales bacterium]|nr:HlyC/CorC family transporter [Sedimentisphaerales bacterium]